MKNFALRGSLNLSKAKSTSTIGSQMAPICFRTVRFIFSFHRRTGVRERTGSLPKLNKGASGTDHTKTPRNDLHVFGRHPILKQSNCTRKHIKDMLPSRLNRITVPPVTGQASVGDQPPAARPTFRHRPAIAYGYPTQVDCSSYAGSRATPLSSSAETDGWLCSTMVQL